MKMCCDKTGGIYKYSGNGGCESPPKEEAELWRPAAVYPPER